MKDDMLAFKWNIPCASEPKGGMGEEAEVQRSYKTQQTIAADFQIVKSHSNL